MDVISQCIDLCTAFFQRPNLWSLAEAPMVGKKVSVVMVVSSSEDTLHTPTAIPAAMAAPRAVVSGMEGRTENKQR